ncbi:tRNA pseudouridine(38-40) synthase TruA [Solilutibacter silvestris]|uniref:tRNA pseudouridine(38-40) synthase TruA n=1 Tax=Solilutibacter silvestris TaxID=1645665 RepID=UPI003D34C479
MPRYALGVEYDGGAFHGWQRVEAGVRSVQETLETALSSVADHDIRVVCAGRTDAGVHARCQVVHFDSDAPRSTRAWALGTTSRLPPDVSALWCREVPETFSARFSAVARRYRYRILNRQIRPAFEHQYLTWELRPLDHLRMHAAAQALLGEHDFESFRSAQCQASHARRELQSISVTRSGDEVVMEVQANAFLHHMVRNIVGSLLPVGRGERPVEWIAALLAGRDRTQAGPTAPADGLVFVSPLYPPNWNLPAEITFSQ